MAMSPYNQEVPYNAIPDSLKHWAEFFGSPNSMDGMYSDMYGSNPVDTHYLPMPWWGSRKVLTLAIINRLIGKRDWWTRYLLPWEKCEKYDIKWTTITFHKAEMDRSPLGAPPRLVQSSANEFTSTQYNYNLGFKMDLQFYKSEHGKKMYDEYLKVLSDSMSLCAYRRIMEELCVANSPYSLWEVQVGKQAPGDMIEALKRRNFAAAAGNKGYQFLARVIAAAKNAMKDYDAAPNLAIFPPNGKLTLRSRPEVNSYSDSGPLSSRVIKDGEETFDLIEGLKVFETVVFPRKLAEEDTQPLHQIFETGSVFLVKNFFGGQSLESYRSAERSAIKILDAKTDNEVTVTLSSLLNKASRFDKDGNLSGYHESMITKSNMSDLRNRMKIDRHDTKIDMFVVTDPSSGTQSVVSKWGEMDPEFLTEETVDNHAESAENILSSLLSEEEKRRIEDLSSFEKKLSVPDVNDINFIIYNIALQQSMSIEGAENAPDGSLGIARGNRFGGVNPPEYIEDANGVHIGFRKSGVFMNVRVETIPNESDFSVTVTPKDNADLPRNTIPIKAVLPWGFATPSGLLTLHDMHQRGERRGYDTEILKKAHGYVETFMKIIPSLSSVYPEHELMNQYTCPFYFKTGDSTLDTFIVTMLNVVSCAKTPFAIRKNELSADDKKRIVDGTAAEFRLRRSLDPSGNNAVNSMENQNPTVPSSVSVNPELAGALGKAILEGIRSLSKDDAATIAPVDFRLKTLWRTTTNPSVRAAFTDSKMAASMKNLYKNKTYKKGFVHTFEQFLASILIENPGLQNDAKQTRKFASALLVLMDPKISRVNWDDLLESASEYPSSLDGVNARENLADVVFSQDNQSIWGSWINTRLHYDASVFISLYQGAEDPVVRSNRKLIGLILPMNPFNLNAPLGTIMNFLVNDGNRSNGVFGNVSRTIKFASSQYGRNSIHTLTTSHVMEDHAERNGDVHASAEVIRRRNPERGNGLSAYRSVAHGYDPENGGYDNLNTLPEAVAFSQIDDLFSLTATEENAFGKKNFSRRYRPWLVRRFHSAAKNVRTLRRMFTQLFLTTRVTLQSLENWSGKNIVLPVACELHRPRQSYEAYPIIIAEGGESLGRTYHGFEDFQLGQDPIEKCLIGHFNVAMAATIQHPEKVMTIANAIVTGYIAGEDVSFVDTPSNFEKLVQDASSKSGSILVKMVPAHVDVPPTVQDISGVWNPVTLATTKFNGRADAFEAHGNSNVFYNHVYGLDTLNRDFGSYGESAVDRKFIVNTEMWRGHQRMCNINGSWSIVVPDAGPFGDDVYPGIIQDRTNPGSFIKEAGYKKNCTPY